MTNAADSVSLPAVRACAQVIHQAATITPDGFANLALLGAFEYEAGRSHSSPAHFTRAARLASHWASSVRMQQWTPFHTGSTLLKRGQRWWIAWNWRRLI
jgi:hypothetical protein